MASVVICAEPGNWHQAKRFAAQSLRDAELKTFEDLRRRMPGAPVLVYLTTPDHRRLRSLLGQLKTVHSDVVVYYANRLRPEDAARLGKIVGETRPDHTRVVFEAQAAASALRQRRSTDQSNGAVFSPSRIRGLREQFGLTQTELAHAVGVSLRTVQNWERAGTSGSPRQLRDLDELWTTLKETMKIEEVPIWLHSPNDALGGERPIDLLQEGKVRDLIVEFRRLQAGEPI